jgi:hypothetical protein
MEYVRFAKGSMAGLDLEAIRHQVIEATLEAFICGLKFRYTDVLLKKRYNITDESR